MGQLPAHEEPCRYGAYAGHEVQLVALPVQLEHRSLHALQLPPLSAYSRGAHALTHEVAALKGVPLTGQLAQSAAVPPVHVAQLSWQPSHARTCAGYLRVSPPYLPISACAPGQDRARDARASALARGEGQS